MFKLFDLVLGGRIPTESIRKDCRLRNPVNFCADNRHCGIKIQQGVLRRVAYDFSDRIV